MHDLCSGKDKTCYIVILYLPISHLMAIGKGIDKGIVCTFSGYDDDSERMVPEDWIVYALG